MYEFRLPKLAGSKQVRKLQNNLKVSKCDKLFYDVCVLITAGPLHIFLSWPVYSVKSRSVKVT